jgi:hypothetical protein
LKRIAHLFLTFSGGTDHEPMGAAKHGASFQARGDTMNDVSRPASNGARKLLTQVTCPHCWHHFSPEDTLWIASHIDLRLDPLLGEAPQRFLPSRFTPEGFALDARGMVCRELACPRCHLEILRDLLEMESLFFSIVGDQASGKSYFLTAMVQQLREVLFHEFQVKFSDADPASNSILTGYIDSLFGRENDEDPVPLGDLITKTQLAGDLYVPVTFGSQTIAYPQPFVFSLQPAAGHPAAGSAQLSRMLCLYDNAGEHFRPGGNRVTNPCADHLALSRAILFLFDPSQDRKFREHCLCETQAKAGNMAPSQQITILNEVAKRVREYKGLKPTELYDSPLIVVLTKYDAWSHLLDGEDEPSDPWLRSPRQAGCLLDHVRIRQRSRQLRELMMRYCREVVAAAEGFARDVTYIAVSSLADRYDPDRLQVDRQSKLVSIRPKDVRPFWVAVPLLYALNQALPRLIPCTQSEANGRASGAGGRAPMDHMEASR